MQRGETRSSRWMADAVDRVSTMVDERACERQVILYANSLDRRDWRTFRALFTDTITLDYASIGSVCGAIAADDWVARCGLLGSFSATRHRVSNLLSHVAGDSATVSSAIDASHFVLDGDAMLHGDLCGTYEHGLRRVSGAWLIEACRLTVAGYPAGKAAFDRAFAVARAIYEKGDRR